MNRTSVVRSFAAFIAGCLLATPAVAFEEMICRDCGRDHWAERAAMAEGHQGGSGRQYAPDRVVDVLHIKIDVTPDFEKRTVSGTTTLTFTPIAKPTDQVRLDAVRLDVEEIDSSVPLADYVVTDEDITLQFAKPVPPGMKVHVAITYSAQPTKGLYFRTEEMGYPKGDDHVWTQGQTHEAPHWFPCFDYPNERATSEVICTVPQEMQVVSNGREVDVEEKEDGKKAVRYLMEKPHASYLICLVAGHFHVLEDQHGDLKLRFFAQPSLAEHAENSFADTRQIIDFFEQETGLPFPWPKYDQATIRDFTSGGMENTTITTLYHNTIFSKATENIYSSRNLDAHETAHQWFGDYITCEDWAHLWLNEGFATYYTHLYNGHKLGRDAMLYGLYKDATGRVLPGAKDPRPIVYRGYDDAWDQFDFRAYPKGSWVLHMLRSQLGEELYRKAINNYLEANALSSVVTPDLMAALEEASGLELDQFFDQWVYHAGNPALKVRYKWLPKEKLAHVTVEQTQDVNDKVLLFEFPTKLRFHVGDEVVDHAVRISKKRQEFYVPLEEQPELVRFDPEYTVLATVDFSKPQKMLERQLKQQGDMIGRIRAAVDLGKVKNQKSIDALQKALNDDAFYGVRIAAAEALADMRTDEAYQALTESLDQDDARVRLQVVESVGAFYRPETLEHLKRVAGEEKNPAIVAAALKSMGKFPADQVRSTLEKGLETESFGDLVAAGAAEALGMSGDTQLRGKMLNVLKGKRRDFDSRRFASAMLVLAKLWRDADDRAPVRSWLEECLQDPAQRIRMGAVAALGELGDAQAIPALQSFVVSEGNGRGRTPARQAISKLESDAPFVPREVKELRKLVNELKDEQAKLQKEVEALRDKKEASESP